MEYLNDRTYKRGEEVAIQVTVPAEKAKTKRGVVFEYTYALFRGMSSGFKIEFRGAAPMITGDEAIVILTAKVESVGDDVYRVEGGVKGRVPGDTVRFERICGLDKPLNVNGEVVDNP